ncbi:MAG TPA: glycosyltransferase family 2 protein, partial [Jatrophihabitans sp.]|nr:glycosyltransferase family 2 protein [Jatrophihabitans sp.]
LTALARHLLDPAAAAAAPRIVARGPDGSRCALDLGTRPAGVRPYTAVSYVPTAVLVARRTALSQVATDGGVFDETLQVGEDVDLVWRLIKAGWRLRYDPGVAVAHTEPRGGRALLARRFRYGTSAAPLARRHPDNVAPFVLHPVFSAPVLAGIRMRPGFALRRGGARPGRVDRTIRHAGLPRRGRVAGTARGLGQTYLGLGRWLTQLAGPVLIGLLAAGSPRARASAAAFLVADVLAARPGRRRPPALARFAVTVLADDIAYGAGVSAGCLKHHTVRPWLPSITTSEITR